MVYCLWRWIGGTWQHFSGDGCGYEVNDSYHLEGKSRYCWCYSCLWWWKGYTDSTNVTLVYEDEAWEFEAWYSGTTVGEVCAAIFVTKGVLGIHMSLEHNQKTNYLPSSLGGSIKLRKLKGEFLYGVVSFHFQF